MDVTALRPAAIVVAVLVGEGKTCASLGCLTFDQATMPPGGDLQGDLRETKRPRIIYFGASLETQCSHSYQIVLCELSFVVTYLGPDVKSQRKFIFKSSAF